jgi:hypothetical protein
MNRETRTLRIDLFQYSLHFCFFAGDPEEEERNKKKKGNHVVVVSMRIFETHH